MRFFILKLHTAGKPMLPVFIGGLLLMSTEVFGETTAERFASAVVRIDSTIFPQGKTIERLGATRSGSAVVIDSSGLVVTAGYLVLEAESVQVTFDSGDTGAAVVVANDLNTGLALLRVELPDEVPAMQIGDSAKVVEGDNAVVLSYAGSAHASVATLASIRPFAGSWEYAIDTGFYTVPALRSFSGAALVNRDAELIGIGSLLLGNIFSDGQSESTRNATSGNLFIPVELLTTRLGPMLSGDQSVDDLRPWLGLYLMDRNQEVVVSSVAPSGPAENAQMQTGDIVMAINSIRVQSMAQLYSTLWSTAAAGDPVSVTVVRDGRLKRLTVVSDDRWNWLVSKAE